MLVLTLCEVISHVLYLIAQETLEPHIRTTTSTTYNLTLELPRSDC